jgi:hypothetical protein
VRDVTQRRFLRTGAATALVRGLERLTWAASDGATTARTGDVPQAAAALALPAVSRAMRPGQVHVFHAWEPYRFRGGASYRQVVPSPIKVTQLVGDYGRLHWAYGYYAPGQVDRDTRVDLAKV